MKNENYSGNTDIDKHGLEEMYEETVSRTRSFFDKNIGLDPLEGGLLLLLPSLILTKDKMRVKYTIRELFSDQRFDNDKIILYHSRSFGTSSGPRIPKGDRYIGYDENMSLAYSLHLLSTKKGTAVAPAVKNLRDRSITSIITALVHEHENFNGTSSYLVYDHDPIADIDDMRTWGEVWRKAHYAYYVSIMDRRGEGEKMLKQLTPDRKYTTLESAYILSAAVVLNRKDMLNSIEGYVKESEKYKGLYFNINDPDISENPSDINIAAQIALANHYFTAGQKDKSIKIVNALKNFELFKEGIFQNSIEGSIFDALKIRNEATILLHNLIKST